MAAPAPPPTTRASVRWRVRRNGLVNVEQDRCADRLHGSRSWKCVSPLPLGSASSSIYQRVCVPPMYDPSRCSCMQWTYPGENLAATLSKTGTGGGIERSRRDGRQLRGPCTLNRHGHGQYRDTSSKSARGRGGRQDAHHASAHETGEHAGVALRTPPGGNRTPQSAPQGGLERNRPMVSMLLWVLAFGIS
jgi:hypothetical protein